MRVLKIVAEGVTTSFRYPQFMQTIHPTYEAPPPATIYGHICSAVGEWVDPEGLAFAYHFGYAGQAVDLEHILVLSASSGKLPGTNLPKVLEGAMNPFQRHILFQPKLVLYINRPEWERAFRSPRYAVVLGRSQDLFTYTSVSTVELEQSEEAYLEHTLLPYEMALQTRRGYVVLMPRYLDYADQRRPSFARYVVLHDRVQTREMQQYDSKTSRYWIDPTSPLSDGAHLGLVFHTFVGDTYESLRLA
jgi:CRISPR-associated protein Cas5t